MLYPRLTRVLSWRRLLALLALLCLAAITMTAEPAPREIVLQLKWKHQFQFAGYYAAEALGYYRDAGLRLRIEELREGLEPVDEVVSGRAEFGVGTTELVLDAAQGKDVVILAVILQHSPFALAALSGSGIEHVHDLAGKRIAVEADAAELWAYLRSEGLEPNSYTRVAPSYDVRELGRGRFDVMAVYTTDDPFILAAEGLDFRLFSPRAAGIDFYGDNLFTRGELLRREPTLVRAFREASLRGWQYALRNPEQVVRLIRERYSQRKSVEHLLNEAREMRRLMMPEVVEIGYMNPGRWRHVAQVYEDQGMLSQEPDWQRLLYRPEPPAADPRGLYLGLILTGLVSLAVIALAWRYARLNTSLRQEMGVREQIDIDLQQSNVGLSLRLEETVRLKHALEDDVVHDPLTGLYNRRYLDQSLERELARAEREATSFALLMLDLDHFKDINDQHGHLAGDAVLRHFADFVRVRCRPSDTACRYGGEEFLVLMPGMDRDAARNRAEQWRAALEVLAFSHEGLSIPLRVSIGVALYPEHGRERDALLHAADLALYAAKAAGRNRVRLAGEKSL